MQKLSRSKTLFIFAAIILVAGFLFFFFARANRRESLPQDFLTAKQEAAEVSQRIVELTSTTNEKIKAVNLSDLEGDEGQALALIQEARRTNEEAYQKAFDLSRYLQKIAESLGELKSVKNQRAVYEAVAVELSLVSEFISYTQSLNNFLDTLAKAVSTNSFADRQTAGNYLNEVNQKAKTINNLNQEFLAKIEKFDQEF